MERIRLDGIDLLRGLSALLVVLHHIHLRFKLNEFEVADLFPEPVVRVLFWSGYYSVIAFFVISGFLITRLSLARWGSLARPQIKQFYLLRAARILPCILLLLAVLSMLHLSGVTGFIINPERSTLPRALVAALTFHINWLEGQHGYLPGSWDVLWSLSVEETFYIVFPLLCFVVRSERILLGLLLVLIVVGPFYRVSVAGQAPWEEYGYLCCMDGIAFGCIAALATAKLKLGKNVHAVLLSLGSLIFLSGLAFRASETMRMLQRVGLDISVYELGVALMLIAFANGVGNTVLSRGAAAIRLIGRCSYEIYLTHMFVVLGLMNVIKGTQLSTTMIFFWYLIMLVLSIALGQITYRFYSEPANRRFRQRFLRESH